MASYWVVAEVSIEVIAVADVVLQLGEIDGVIRGIALVLAIVAFLIWAFVTTFWPIILTIVIFIIGLIAYYWWKRKAVDPTDYGPGGSH